MSNISQTHITAVLCTKSSFLFRAQQSMINTILRQIKTIIIIVVVAAAVVVKIEITIISSCLTAQNQIICAHLSWPREYRHNLHHI